jgi:protein-S-isoprenylcysteine O-methyltransferase Ste14
MSLFGKITIVCWVVFWLYWLVSAFGSKKGTNPNIKQFLGIRLVFIVVAAIVATSLNKQPYSFQNRVTTKNEAVLALGFVIFLLGLILAVWARIYLGKNWGMPMTKKEDPELVTTGPYRYVRHPIYSGILLMAFGSAVDISIFWLIVLVIAALYFTYSALVEERLMMKQFPKVYPAYKSKTKMLIPFIG